MRSALRSPIPGRAINSATDARFTLTRAGGSPASFTAMSTDCEYRTAKIIHKTTKNKQIPAIAATFPRVNWYHATPGSGTLPSMFPQSSYTVLGVDPGTRRVGWAAVRLQGRSYLLVASGAIAPHGETRESRLAAIHAELCRVAGLYKPDAAAIEEVFAGKNLKAALAIGEGRGVAMAAMGAAGLSVSAYAARVIKRAVTGNGGASKEQVARMAAMQLGIAKPPGPHDVSDACAVALTHLIRRALPV